MNYARLVTTLALLTLCVAVIGLAGKATVLSSAKAVQTTGQIQKPQPFAGDAQLSDRSPQALAKQSPPMVNLSQEMMSPTPKMDATSAMTSGLSGVYHIPGDFTSIGAAVAVLNYVGLSGNTTFQLDATSYSEPTAITFGNYPGAGTYTVTVAPGTGVYATVNFVASNTNGKGFAFNGANGVTIDGSPGGLLLQYSSSGVFPLVDSMSATVYITGASQNITVKNVNIHGYVNNAVWANQTEGRPAVFVWASNADAMENTNLTFDADTMSGATYGFKALSQGNNFSMGQVAITNCRIGGAFGDPVAIGGLYELTYLITFAHNIIDGSQFLDWYWNNHYTEMDRDQVFAGSNLFMYGFGQSTAMHWLLVDGGVFHDNIIRNIGTDAPAGDGILTYGTRVYSYNFGLNETALLYNNRVYGLTNPGGGGSQINGIRGPAGHVYHNSIQIGGATASTSLVVNGINGTTDAYNNAISIEMTGGTPGNHRAVATGGTIDHNALYSTGAYANTTPNTAAGAAANGVNAHGTAGPINFTADLHLNAAGPSSAENMGQYHILAKPDIDGDARDTTIAGTRDAGADEVAAPLAAQWVNDVAVGTIPSPNPGGVPSGLPVIPKVVVKNNTNAAVGPFNVNLTITGTTPYNQTVAVTLGPEEVQTVSFPAWTPAAGSDTLHAATQLAGDVVPGNDAVSRTQSVAPPVVVPGGGDLTYTWNTGSDSGWTRTVDFVRTSSFTKLGGPVSGAAMITNNPLNPATYTEGAYANTQGYSTTYPGPNLLVSPWFDLSALTTDVFVSFQHSINTEPGWDGSWMEYTTDGVNWKKLGQLNDANGINWYNTAVYANAQSLPGDPPDTTTMKFPNYGLYGPGTANPVVPMAWWTSNGDPNGADVPTGPNGWIFAQLHLTAATYPDIVGAPLVKFRYVAFADAVGSFQGWAVDNWHVGANGAVFSGDTISGHVFTDLNGNGTLDGGEPAETGLKAYLFYFGVLKDSTTTNGTGDYQFLTAVSNGGLPGDYQVQIVKAGFTSDNKNTNTKTVNVPGAGAHATADFGLYQGSVSGTVYEDVNNNGTKDVSEPGLSGWVVSLHADSANGTTLQSFTTASGGAYTFLVTPGTYYVKETLKAGWQKNQPAGAAYTATVSGTSGSGTAIVTGDDFGNFRLGVLRVENTVDINGNGVKEVADGTGLPAGAYVIFDITKDGNPFVKDTLGNGVSSVVVHSGLAPGTYQVTPTFASPLWVSTLSTGNTFVVNTSGGVDTSRNMYFKIYSVTGVKFEDLNGNGVQDNGEPGLAGWTVNVSGTVVGGASAVTDASGNWTVDSVGGGKHFITETNQAGWVQTTPAVPDSIVSNYATIWTGAGTGVVTSKPLGNFKTVCISGVKYRDLNHNGVRDAGEAGMAGVTITVDGAGGTSTTTAGDGTYQICGLGPGNHNVTQTELAGFMQTQPSTPGYSFAATSNTNVANLDFGDFQISDSTYLYRSFTMAEWVADAAVPEKATKRPSVKKPTFPNPANVLQEYFKIKALTVQVGVQSATTAPYLLLAKDKDFQQSYNKKGVVHTPTSAHGFDFDQKGKLMLKKFKSLPASKQDNGLAMNLLALNLNIALSAEGNTPAGFGNLIYDDGVNEPTECQQYGFPLNGKTVMQISAIGDTLMTYWQFVPRSCFNRLLTVVANINAAFSQPWTPSTWTDVDSANWWSTAKLFVKGMKPVTAVSYMRSNPHPTPIAAPVPQSQRMPTVYALYQNYPNPFNPTTTIEFDLPEAANVTIAVYNILGQQVATLVNHEAMDAGNNSVDFDGTNLASGVYLYRIVAEQVNDDGISTGQNFTQVKKMILMK